jgi:anaerobic dimethyl sulfoxide reductase subunit B (iron-sulfur subunit)
VPTQYAFFVNSDACSGCKTCQVACKDKHDIPAGVHWRRVFEVTSGEWLNKAGAWTTTVAAYNLSTACHHCASPVCGRQCSTEAIWKRPDGIVLIDESRCTRCRKCQADCPYGAIAWDASANMVKKCHFCCDYLDAGLPPACVAACPNRALEFGEFEELKARPGSVRQVFPMADPSLAGPAVVIRPHRDAARVQSRAPQIANWEEL